MAKAMGYRGKENQDLYSEQEWDLNKSMVEHTKLQMVIRDLTYTSSEL